MERGRRRKYSNNNNLPIEWALRIPDTTGERRVSVPPHLEGPPLGFCLSREESDTKGELVRKIYYKRGENRNFVKTHFPRSSPPPIYMILFLFLCLLLQ